MSHNSLEKENSNSRFFYVVNVLLPNKQAHGIQITNMCAGFSKKHSNVTLVLPKQRGVCAIDLYKYYDVPGEFKIKFLPVLLLPATFGKIRFQLRTATFLPIAYIYLLFVTRKNDIVYCRGEVALLACWLPKKIRLCWETHIRPRSINRYRHVLNRSLLVVTVTKYYARELLQAGVSKKTVVTEPDCVRTDNLGFQLDKKTARKRLGLPTNRRILLYTGSNLPWKGVDLLREAVQLLPETYLLVQVGDIPKEHGKDSRFFYAGQVSNSEIPTWLAAGDLLVLTGSTSSRVSNLYTSPLKLFEYMAAARPILAFDVPSFREILDESRALFFSGHDPSELATLIESIDWNSQILLEKVRGSSELVKAYTWEKRASRIINMINNVQL